MRPRFLRAKAGIQPPKRFVDGIHLDFAYGAGSLGCYVKAVGGAVTQAALTSLFTFSGGNQSMIMGPGGLLVASATNTPRIEYDANGNCKGLLMEAARTNLALHSSDGTNAAWVKSNTTAAKTATGPDGVSNSATTVTASAGNGTILQTVTSASAQRTFAIWLKRRTGTGNIDMTVDGGTGWTTKTITSSWARYSITQSAVTNPSFGLRIVTSGNQVDFYGAQLESAPFASSTIPTTTAGVARTADSCVRTLGSEFSATAGTVAVTGTTAPGTDATAQFFYNFDDGTTNDRIGLVRLGGGTTMSTRIFDGGAAQLASADTVASNAQFRAAAAYASGDLASSVNGAAIQSSAGALPTVTTLAIGTQVTTIAPANGHIRKFDYWPTRLPNGFLTSY